MELWEQYLQDYLSLSSPTIQKDFYKKIETNWFSDHEEALDMLLYSREDKITDIIKTHPNLQKYWDAFEAIKDPGSKLLRLWRAGWLLEFEKEIKEYVQRIKTAKKDSSKSTSVDPPDDQPVRKGRKKSS